jgi:hypothetical protein
LSGIVFRNAVTTSECIDNVDAAGCIDSHERWTTDAVGYRAGYAG